MLLATHDDIAALLQRPLTLSERDHATEILTKASELFRRHSGQQFTPGRSEVERIVTAGCVQLPQRPVTDVHAVTDQYGHLVPYTRRGQKLTLDRMSGEKLLVDYSHGSEDVPDLVRITVAEIARKVLSIDPHALQGIQQRTETTGPFSDSASYAQWALGGQTALSPADLEVARSFRTSRHPSVIVTQP